VVSHIIVLEMGAEDAPAELADIGDDEGRAQLCPRNEVCRLWVVDHPRVKKCQGWRMGLGRATD
jgi:hypothetical protein